MRHHVVLTVRACYITIRCSVSGTVRVSAAQPRQVWKEAAVSGCLLRRGAPDTERFFKKAGFLLLISLVFFLVIRYTEFMAAQYEVTASKYRPKTFDELAGQEFVVSTIKNSLKNAQIAPAYLFSGPRGCGKTSAARILARSLNCLTALQANDQSGKKELASEPCGICDNCRAISRGASMDVLEIDGASNNSVNDIRQIKDEVLFPPQTGRYKVYIIDEVHMLSGSAFNALLKTIEEPPPYIVFIFATTELHKVPATIKSRCQQFNFRLISVEKIQELLKKICEENSIKADDDALFWIARESTGSLRDAFTLFDQIVSFSAGHIRSETIREKLGITGLEKLNALAEFCAAEDSAGAFALTDEILSSGVAIEQFVIDLAGYYRSLLLLKNNVTRESLLGYRPSQFSAKALETYDSIRLEQALDILLDCYRNIRFSVSPCFDLETAVSKLTWLSKWVSPSELKEAIEDARSVIGNSGASRPSKPSVVPVEAPVRHAAATSPDAPRTGDGGRSLSDEFRRLVMAKGSSSAKASAEDDDVPMWGTVRESKEETPEQVEKVLSIIPGTLVNPENSTERV